MTSEERRRLENAALIKRMRSNESLIHTDFGAYRWAPRPLVKKDPKAILQIFGEQRETHDGQ